MGDLVDRTVEGILVGLGRLGRPGDLADDTSLWEALKLKKDLVTQVPGDRWASSELQSTKRSEPGRSITFSAGVLSHVDE
ncbi:MAG: hypothetical protein IE935_13820, partial [Micrococcales bacterium]|nr:hypothetical protein [Micrococcales bacterium]